MIALKSELAARLAEIDPGRAVAEMREVQRLAADALSETRALVQGYRRTTLEAEIANAARVLAAADIDVRLELEPIDSLPAPAQHLLGLVVREAVTNMLRHSHATWATVEYRVDDGRAHLRVSNNGATAADQGVARPAANAPRTGRTADTPGAGQGADTRGTGRAVRTLGTRRAPDTSGTGLTSLAERFAAFGGEVTWKHDGDRFDVTTTLPVTQPGRPRRAKNDDQRGTNTSEERCSAGDDD